MNSNYKLTRLCSALAYGCEPAKPQGISAPRWAAMIKSASIWVAEWEKKKN